MAKKKLTSDDYINQALKNIELDRASAGILLNKLTHHLLGSDDRHEKSGMVAAKYLETLQRSNEQLVKLISMIKKDEIEISSAGFKSEDIYDKIEEELDDEEEN